MRESLVAEGCVAARVKREVVSCDNFASMFFAFDKFVTSCKAAGFDIIYLLFR